MVTAHSYTTVARAEMLRQHDLNLCSSPNQDWPVILQTHCGLLARLMEDQVLSVHTHNGEFRAQRLFFCF